jgi:hypothetical protein
MMAKFPLRFAQAVLFGDGPVRSGVPIIRNATASLLDLGAGPLAVTCHHVIQEYRLRAEHRPSLFQIGDCRLDPLQQLIFEDDALDLAAIALTPAQARQVAGGGDTGSSFFSPATWPPEPVCEGDYIAFGGFPGELRRVDGHDSVTFSSFSNGASRVPLVRDTYFVSQFEREYWVTSFWNLDSPDLRKLGGLSGGPAFILRKLHYDFVGLMYEFSEDYEVLYFRHANVLTTLGGRH